MNKEHKDFIIEALSFEYQGDSEILLAQLSGKSKDNFITKSERTSSFHKDFLNIAKKVFPSDNKSNIDEILDFLIENDIAIYFPYMEYFDESELENLTITYHPLNDLQTEFEGFTVDLTNRNFELEPVIVDDDYAISNPTLIIVPHQDCSDCIVACPVYDDIPRDLIPCPYYSGGGGYTDPGGGYAGNHGGTSSNRYIDCRELDIDDIVWARIGNQMMLDDHWVSLVNGGTRITMLRASGAIDFSGEPSAYPYVLYQDFLIKRKDINNKNWVWSPTDVFDDDWKMEEADQVISFVNYRQLGTMKDFGGNVKVGMDSNGNPSLDVNVGVAFNASSFYRGRPKYYNQFDRCAALATAKTSAGWGLRQGWQIKKHANLHWFMTYQVIN